MAGAVGRYELVRAIGRGGMAEVFLARRRGAAGIAKRLVVKRVRQDLTCDPRFAELFLREARVATLLSHKNIVTVFDVGRDDEGLFLAMDFVDGPDLALALERARERDRRFDPLLVAHIAGQVAAGLDYAHRLRDEAGRPIGLVHRDVTPRNVLLSLDGEVKVTDFGVAVLASEAREERRGTVPYMSPEQARGEQADPRSDLFALGLVMHELLTGVRVHDARDLDAALRQAQAAIIPPLPADTPAALVEVIERATAPDRDARYPTARAMQRDLAGFAVAENARRGPSEPPEHALAAFLAELFPDWGERGEADAVGRTVGLAGTATLASVAVTVAGDPAPASTAAAPEVARPADTPAPSPPADAAATAGRRAARPWRAAVAVGAVVSAAIAALIIAGARDTDPAASATLEPAGPARPAARAPAARPASAATGAVAPTTTPGATTSPSTGPSPSPLADPPAAARRDPPGERGARRRPPRPASAAADTAAPGILDLNAVPWAYVSIDGGPEEETPVRGRRLSPGRHAVRIRNPVLEREREMTVRISSGETSRYVVDLRQ